MCGLDKGSPEEKTRGARIRILRNRGMAVWAAGGTHFKLNALRPPKVQQLIFCGIPMADYSNQRTSADRMQT